MIIYRIEDEHATGPYQTYCDDPDFFDLSCDMVLNHENSPEHPDIYSDFGLQDYEYLYGCLTEISLRRWFGMYFSRLLEYGFSIVKIEVPDKYTEIGKSGHQVRFIENEILTKIIPHGPY